MTEALDLIWLASADGADLSEFDDPWFMIQLAGCSLDEKPGSNWVQDNGGLPDYICRIARALKRSGHDTSEAVALAVGTVKNWANGQKHVNEDTRAKAAAAVTAWEALKAKAHGKSDAKKVAATAAHAGFVALCAQEFNTDIIGRAFQQDMAPKMYPQKADPYDGRMRPVSYSYPNQIWTTFVIADGDLDGDGDVDYYKIPFSVDPSDGTSVTWGDPVEVKQTWVNATTGDPVSGTDGDLDASDMTDDDMNGLLDLSRSGGMDALDKFLMLAGKSDSSGAAKGSGFKPAPYVKESDETVKCPNCGKGDAPDARYCDQCGFKLEGAEGVVKLAAASSSDKKPYGNVEYADPKNGKYPIDTADHVRAAWSYINQEKNEAKYPMNGVTLSSVKAKIKAAAKKLGVKLNTDPDNDGDNDLTGPDKDKD